MNKRPLGLTLALFGLLIFAAFLSNTVLFSQGIKGQTDFTKLISEQLGPWRIMDHGIPSDQEYRGLETRDVIKRTYSDGEHLIELVVAYIPESNRKSAHAQESCLRGSGALVGSIQRKNLPRIAVDATVISIEHGQSKAWVYYWFKFGSEHSSAYLKANFKMLLAGLKGGKAPTGASLIRLHALQTRGEPGEKVQRRLDEFAAVLVPELNLRLP